MAYSDLDVELVYVGDDLATSFFINFAYIDEDSVQVELYNTTDPDNPVQEAFIKGVDYTLADNLITTTDPLPVDKKLLIYRRSSPVHETSYSTFQFPFSTVNNDLDYITQLAQENRRLLDTAILNPYYNYVANEGRQLTFEQLYDTFDSVATNQAQLDALDARITSNDNDIADHESRLSVLDRNVIPLITASVTHNALNGQILIVRNTDITIQLPGLDLGVQIVIKMHDLQANTLVQTSGADVIDGFGTSYTLLSAYESVTLICDGNQWYII